MKYILPLILCLCLCFTTSVEAGKRTKNKYRQTYTYRQKTKSVRQFRPLRTGLNFVRTYHPALYVGRKIFK